MGTDLGDEIIEVASLRGLPFPLDPQEKGERAVLGRGDDQARPARGVEGPDIRVLPGIEDLGLENGRRRGHQHER